MVFKFIDKMIRRFNMKKLALITGINYEGTPDELGGCINDASNILHKLVQDFNFNQSDIQLLIEEVATRKNILDGLKWLVSQLEPGDIGVFTYSGHGTQTADLPPIGENDMLDEAIVPIDALSDDSNLIRDDEIHEILLNLANGVRFVLIFDSCHSATVTRTTKSIHEIKETIRNAETIDEIQEVIKNLKTKDIKTSTKLTSKNPNDKKRHIQLSNTVERINKIMAGLNISTRDSPEHPLAGPGHILLSGCKANEVSYDDGTSGYFTRALLNKMKKGITYQELYDLAKEEVLDRSNNKQSPQLEGPQNLINMNIFE